MTRDEVIALMETSQTREQWNTNCDVVKANCNGYPPFWFEAIIQSGVGDRIAARWGSDMKIRAYNPVTGKEIIL